MKKGGCEDENMICLDVKPKRCENMRNKHV